MFSFQLAQQLFLKKTSSYFCTLFMRVNQIRLICCLEDLSVLPLTNDFELCSYNNVMYHSVYSVMFSGSNYAVSLSSST